MADDVIPLSRFQAVLGRARGSKRVDFLLAQPDAASIVAEMPVQDLYYLVKEVGLADARELLDLATPEQFQSFLDLDAWQRDHLEPAEARPWLAALVDSGPEKLTEVWRALDPELAGLLIARHTRVYNVAEVDVPEDEEPPFYPTPDRFFVVKITSEDPEDVRVVERTLDSLYRVDQELARHILRSAQTETTVYLEETSYRFRAGRMQELGYADYYDALEVYRPLSAGEVQIGEATADSAPGSQVLPAPLADPTIRMAFLGRVLALVVQSDEARRLESALVMLLNRVLAADRVNPGDLEVARTVGARAAATLSVGLEAVARGNAEQGLEALRTISLTRLHRVGYTLGLRLVRLLDTLGPRVARRGGSPGSAGRGAVGPLIEEPHLSLVAALREPRPAFPRALEEPPAAGSRPLATLADVARVTALLADLATQIRLVYDVLGQDPVKIGAGVTLGDVIRTAVVQAALGRGATFAPVTPADLLAYQRLEPSDAEARAVAAFPPEYRTILVGFIAGKTVVTE